jgi:hypothetical protein
MKGRIVAKTIFPRKVSVKYKGPLLFVNKDKLSSKIIKKLEWWSKEIVINYHWHLSYSQCVLIANSAWKLP